MVASILLRHASSLRSARAVCLLLAISATLLAPVRPLDCSSGCPLSPTAVCGSDGHTYANECLAVCQGVKVASAGPCETDSFFNQLPFVTASSAGSSALIKEESSSASAEPTISKDVLQLFKEESYNYVGRVRTVAKLSKEHWQLQREKNYTGMHPQDLSTFNVLRITNTGDAYIRTFDASEAAQEVHMQAESASYAPPASASSALKGPGVHVDDISINTGRKLRGVIGTDDRQMCPIGMAPPFSAIGQLTISQTGSEALCTGALFRKDKVLTAAHCLYDEKASAFVMDVSFAPGRYQAGGKNVDPFGIAKMSFISIADAYFKSKGTAYDYGVLTVGSPIGLRTGTFGLKAASCSGSEYVWSAVAGYPGDKAGSNGQCWYSKCWVLFNKPCSGEPVYYSCDTSVGQSGAPVFDQDRYIRAVHVAMAEMQAPNGQKFAANVGTPIFPAVFDAIAGV